MAKSNIVNIPDHKDIDDNNSSDVISVTKNVLELTEEEAKEFFLKSESYCNFDLPPYFEFNQILADIDTTLKNKNLSDFKDGSPRDHSDINYKILNNKDGRYSWRPMQLIHPALYVSLVHKIIKKENWKIICDQYKEFSKNHKIECVSLPRLSVSEDSDLAEQVSHWWNEVEQRSIELALEFDHLTHTDITDCYGAIYTHSVAWALHGKDFMKIKANRNDKALIGNIIDTHLQDMSYGQTNGIPQGSALMDFIAEMVLGYADMLLTEKIDNQIVDYKIIRYRDDYRVFVNNPRDGEKIIKYLTEIMIELGLKLSAEKTKSTNEVIKGSIKSDKLFWIKQKQTEKSLQKHFLIIHGLSYEYPNSGSLVRGLQDYYSRLLKVKNYHDSAIPLISIAVDIAYKNPRTYPYIAAIISLLLTSLKTDEKKIAIIDKIRKKFSKIPNTGHLEIWLQRVTLGIKKSYDYDEPLCQLAAGNTVNIWNADWLNQTLKKMITSSEIVSKQSIVDLPISIPKQEVQLFKINDLHSL